MLKGNSRFEDIPVIFLAAKTETGYQVEGYLKPGTTKYDEILNNHNNTTQETYSLLINLLEWTRSQTLDLELSPEEIPVKDLISITWRFMEQQAAKKDYIIPAYG